MVVDRFNVTVMVFDYDRTIMCVCDVFFFGFGCSYVFQNFWTVLGKDGLLLLNPQHETVQVQRYGALLYLTHELVPFDRQEYSIVYDSLDSCQSNMTVDLNHIQLVETEDNGPLKRFEDWLVF